MKPGVALGLKPWEDWEEEVGGGGRGAGGGGTAWAKAQSHICFRANSHFVLYSNRLRAQAQ